MKLLSEQKDAVKDGKSHQGSKAKRLVTNFNENSKMPEIGELGNSYTQT